MRNTDFEPEHLLFLDVETTGLNHDTDLLIQVGGFMTDHRLELTSDRTFEYTIRLDRDTMEYVRDTADPFVRDMHTHSGLWDATLTGTPLADVDEAVHDFILGEGAIPKKVRLAGNSVKLDFDFTNTNLPRTASLLSYRIIDISGIAFVMAAHKVTSGYYPKDQPHTSLADCFESLAELRWIMAHVHL